MDPTEIIVRTAMAPAAVLVVELEATVMAAVEAEDATASHPTTSTIPT